MQQYLRKGRFSAFMDEAGLRVLVALAAVGWFVYLWGLKVPSILAGAALGVMGQMALSRWRRKALLRREQTLRRRLGGEIFLENMLLVPPHQAHFQAALLLGEQYPLTLERITDSGVICKSGEEGLLVGCIPLPEGCDTPTAEILKFQRACRRAGAVRAVVCCTGKVSPAVEQWAQSCDVPVRMIHRAQLLTLAGQLSPATDEQLANLAKRKKGLAHGGIRTSVFRPDKAKRYFVYGTSMLAVHVATGLRYYLLPGLLCLLLGTVSRLARQKKQAL